MTQTPTTRVTFAKNIGFRKELNKRVDAYFQSENIKTRDNFAMYFKSAIILGWVAFSWIFTLFSPNIIWMKILGCIMLGMGFAGVGFSVGHDANHGGYSSKKWVNSTFGLTYDFIIGLSSYLWRCRHNLLHHTYTNIIGHDVEIDGDGLVRMSPAREHKWYHQYQHLVINFVYAIIPFYWSIADVYLILFKRKYHEYNIPKPSPLQLMILIGAKFVWLGLYVGIPFALGYSPIQIIIGLCIVNMLYGVLICNVFMLAHVLEPAEFIEPNSLGNVIDDEWAIFQVKTTVDFAPKNRFLNWYLGGLNYQVVHHLFPQICHIHYPQIAPILAQVCQEYDVKYNVYPTFTKALVANYSWLKLMGNPPQISQVTPQIL
ncbi:acyl-CoA desaturase [Plectonema cf. radiosum LEGE 06105]|uniref:Acyl-CoA desaturase n=1 Tax=Plectonema cf. radiosum LEGE 06105 TaxID=945769 RepID=A0A8J7F5J8_9CYAN|nr:acyl-CoA desaturase [Plectonema radiosum]MBE9215657.1 acyl-CoA desaturase [Plectonema cf. radiosum LEGE 06105]